MVQEFSQLVEKKYRTKLIKNTYPELSKCDSSISLEKLESIQSTDYSEEPQRYYLFLLLIALLNTNENLNRVHIQQVTRLLDHDIDIKPQVASFISRLLQKELLKLSELTEIFKIAKLAQCINDYQNPNMVLLLCYNKSISIIYDLLSDTCNASGVYENYANLLEQINLGLRCNLDYTSITTCVLTKTLRFIEKTLDNRERENKDIYNCWDLLIRAESISKAINNQLSEEIEKIWKRMEGFQKRPEAFSQFENTINLDDLIPLGHSKTIDHNNKYKVRTQDGFYLKDNLRHHIFIKSYINYKSFIKNPQSINTEIQIYKALQPLRSPENCFPKFYGTCIGSLQSLETNESPSVLNLAIEYFDMTLKQYLSKLGNLINNDDFLRLTSMLIRSFAEMHSVNIYHLDIHPSNIVVSFDLSRIGIIDFNVSVIKDSDYVEKIERHPAVGVEGFTAPEFAEAINNKNRTNKMVEVIYSKADVFSLGMTLYYAATLDEEKGLNLQRFAELDRKIEEVSYPWLIGLLKKMLRFEPEERVALKDLLAEFESVRTRTFTYS